MVTWRVFCSSFFSAAPTYPCMLSMSSVLSIIVDTGVMVHVDFPMRSACSIVESRFASGSLSILLCSSAVFFESYVERNVSEALSAEVEAVLADVRTESAASSAFDSVHSCRSFFWCIVFEVFGELPRFTFELFDHFSEVAGCHYCTSMPNVFCMYVIASCLVIWWCLPILDFFIVRRLTRYPGRESVTLTSKPITPIFGSYSTPGTSIYSCMPKERLPWLSNCVALSFFSFAWRNLVRSSVALVFRRVSLHPIGSPGLRPHPGILFWVIVLSGSIPVMCLMR